MFRRRLLQDPDTRIEGELLSCCFDGVAYHSRAASIARIALVLFLYVQQDYAGVASITWVVLVLLR